MTRISYLYTSSALQSEEIRNSSTVQNGFIRPAFFMKQVDFLNKIVTSYFEHNIKTDFCSSVKLVCTVTRAEHAGLIVFRIQLL